MFPFQTILKKREKQEFTREDIFSFISQLTHDQVSDSQVGAFLMACFINGLSSQETAFLTSAMAQSGSFLMYDEPKKMKVDKHSTGGVGDKISFLVFPICVANGLAVPMIAGRGLGHTGGTLDKLESIPEFNIHLSNDDMNRCMRELGGFIIGQSKDIAPADRILYKTRDVTATVDNSAFITSSILSKKLAEKLDFLVLDLKTGEGAFMKTLENARELGSRLKQTAEYIGLNLEVVLTRMEQPLGKTVGNWLELEETEECLKGKMEKDIKDLTYALCIEMLIHGKVAKDREEALKKIDEVIQNGKALEAFYKIIELQGGDWKAAKIKYQNQTFWEVKAEKTGYIHKINPLTFGRAGLIIGISRKMENDNLDYGAGFIFEKKVGDFVNKEETLYRIYTSCEEKKQKVEEYLKEAVEIGEEVLEIKDIVIEKM